jgi:cyanophycinase-like exopeptidase
MSAESKPMFLLADSQLLFPRAGDPSLMARVKAVLPAEPARAKAAYLGASNGDAPEHFALFVEAMEGLGIVRCIHVRQAADDAQRSFLAEADLVLLAGGDVGAGWRALNDGGLVPMLRAAPKRGVVVLGVSAGAVQMGMLGRTTDDAGEPLTELLGLVPYAIGVHEQPGWPTLHAVVRQAGRPCAGVGIPMGGAAMVHADGRLEGFGKSLVAVTAVDG